VAALHLGGVDSVEGEMQPDDGVGHKGQGQRQQKHGLTQLLGDAATLRWILQQLHSKTVLARIGACPNKCTIKHPFHT
jgi:hypothetical protein